MAVEEGALVFSDFTHSFIDESKVSLVFLVVNVSQEFVIFFVSVELKWVLIIGEESVVSVGEISKSSTLKSNNHKIRRIITM